MPPINRFRRQPGRVMMPNSPGTGINPGTPGINPGMQPTKPMEKLPQMPGAEMNPLMPQKTMGAQMPMQQHPIGMPGGFYPGTNQPLPQKKVGY